MKQIKTNIIINTEPFVVWQVLINVKEYPDWNPFIKKVEGNFKKGESIKVFIQPPKSKLYTFKPKIIYYSENIGIRWLGKLFTGGIFDGEHYFKLEYLEADKTRLIQGEKFRGILVPFMNKSIRKTRVGFNLMNKALKQKCESLNT